MNYLTSINTGYPNTMRSSCHLHAHFFAFPYRNRDPCPAINVNVTAVGDPTTQTLRSCRRCETVLSFLLLLPRAGSNF